MGINLGNEYVDIIIIIIISSSSSSSNWLKYLFNFLSASGDTVILVTLKTEAVRTSVPLLSYHSITRHHNPEDLDSNSTLRMDATRSSETPVSYRNTTRPHNPEGIDSNLHPEDGCS
jgi:hypothetical protein